MTRTWRIVPLLLGTLAAAWAAPARAESVRVGFYPSRDRAEVVRAAQAFCEFCAASTGFTVEAVVADNYTENVNALTEGKIDLAWLSPISVVHAVQNGEAQVLLKSMRREQPYYWGAVIVRAESSVKTIADLKGKRFGWTDPTSTAGHLLTRAALIRAGVRPEKEFGSNQFLGGHDRLVQAVLKGTVDAGATFANDPEKGIGAWTVYLKPEEATRVRAIFYTEPIPGDAIAGSAPLLADRKADADTMVSCLLSMGDDPQGKTLLQALYNVDRLIPAESKDYDTVRLAVEALRQGP
jgi:phosphate/phosphite/phosphonate ABC transporter binding protein